LQNDLYMVGKRVCKIYQPRIDIEGDECYWVQYQDDLDVSIVKKEDLKLLDRNGRLLYGIRRKTKI
jgi:hypothetical protein